MSWRTTTLGACCDIVSGATPPTADSRYWDGDIEWATPKDLSELEGKYIERTARRITQEGLDSSAVTVLPPHSVLFSSRAPIGHVAINTVPMATNQGFKSFVPKPEQIDSDFLYYWLRANRRFLENLGNGATFKEVSKAVVSRVHIRLPSVEEQRRIAKVLDKADVVHRKRKDAVILADELLRSVFLDMVGPGSPDYTRWNVRSIESLAIARPNAMRTGPFGSDLLHSEFVDQGIAVLGIDNAVQNQFAWGERRFVTPEKYERLRRYTVSPGDVIVTIMGTTGRSAVVPDDIPLAITTKHLATVTVNRSEAEPEFVSQALFRHPDVLRQIAAANRGAIMSGLNLGLIKTLRLPVPPIDTQREFARVTGHIRAMTTRLEAARAASADLFESLVGRAFHTSTES